MKYDCSNEFDLNIIFLKLIGACTKQSAELPDEDLPTTAFGNMPTLTEFQRAVDAIFDPNFDM